MQIHIDNLESFKNIIKPNRKINTLELPVPGKKTRRASPEKG